MIIEKVYIKPTTEIFFKHLSVTINVEIDDR